MKFKIFLLLGLVSSFHIYTMDIPEDKIGIVNFEPSLGYQIISKDGCRVIQVKRPGESNVAGWYVDKSLGGSQWAARFAVQKDWYAIAEIGFAQKMAQKAADLALKPLAENKMPISESNWKKLRKKIAKNLCCCINSEND